MLKPGDCATSQKSINHNFTGSLMLFQTDFYTENTTGQNILFHESFLKKSLASIMKAAFLTPSEVIGKLVFSVEIAVFNHL